MVLVTDFAFWDENDKPYLTFEKEEFSMASYLEYTLDVALRVQRG
jgi:hypothetical protein